MSEYGFENPGDIEFEKAEQEFQNFYEDINKFFGENIFALSQEEQDALIKAKKDFELVVVPGMGHSGGGEFGERKRRDFFVRHLLHVEPPAWTDSYPDKKP